MMLTYYDSAASEENAINSLKYLFEEEGCYQTKSPVMGKDFPKGFKITVIVEQVAEFDYKGTKCPAAE
jgi:hypothetical protein